MLFQTLLTINIYNIPLIHWYYTSIDVTSAVSAQAVEMVAPIVALDTASAEFLLTFNTIGQYKLCASLRAYDFSVLVGTLSVVRRYTPHTLQEPSRIFPMS